MSARIGGPVELGRRMIATLLSKRHMDEWRSD